MKLVSIVGARPQFVKLAPISRAIDFHNSRHTGDSCIEHTVIHTGQHYDLRMSDVFFREIDLPTPQANLGVGSGPHGQQTGRMIEQLERVFLESSPDVVLVYGDTNSTLAAALAAAKLHIPVAHVEAGLRSFNKKMPEEINRVLTDHASTILFCPTRQAVENAVAEGFSKTVFDGDLLPFDLNDTSHFCSCSADRPLVLNVGDVMYDSVLQNAKLAEQRSGILTQLHLKSGNYALATVHRASNTDNPERLRSIFQALNEIARSIMPVIIPLHPRTCKQLNALSNPTNPTNAMNPTNLIIIDPIGYLDMLALERNARMILTDSGGVQKEAYFSQVPCVTLREETEWVELVEAGWNRLGGADPKRIQDAVRRALAFNRANQATLLYGDGHASERIVQLLEDWCTRV